MTLISAQTRKAYEESLYEVKTTDGQTVILCTGRPAVLDGPDLLPEDHLIIITAYNPAGCTFCADENMARNAALAVDLGKLPVPVTESLSYAEDGSHQEPGYCVWLNRPFEKPPESIYRSILSLAEKYGQAAVFTVYENTGRVKYLKS